MDRATFPTASISHGFGSCDMESVEPMPRYKNRVYSIPRLLDESSTISRNDLLENVDTRHILGRFETCRSRSNYQHRVLWLILACGTCV